MTGRAAARQASRTALNPGLTELAGRRSHQANLAYGGGWDLAGQGREVKGK